jgi:hypothetical protein
LLASSEDATSFPPVRRSALPAAGIRTPPPHDAYPQCLTPGHPDEQDARSSHLPAHAARGRFHGMFHGMKANDRPRLHHAQSLALHAAVAQRILANPDLIDRARARLDVWLARDAGSTTPLWLRWKEILTGSPAQVVAVLTDPSDDAAWLRKASPFAGALEPRERERILHRVRSLVEPAA